MRLAVIPREAVNTARGDLAADTAWGAMVSVVAHILTEVLTCLRTVHNVRRNYSSASRRPGFVGNVGKM